MKLQPTSIALALAASIGGLAALPAQAALVTTASDSFSDSASVIDLKGGGETGNNGATLGVSSIRQFDKNLGVLTGAKLNLTNSTHQQKTQVAATDGGNNGNNGNNGKKGEKGNNGNEGNNDTVTATGTGSSSVSISAPGVSQTFLTLEQSGSCSNGRLGACTASAAIASSPTDWVGNVPSSFLGSYVGSGTVSVARTAPTLTANQSNNVFTGEESTTSTVTWTGDLFATYTYLLHAAPSFGNDSLTLDLNLGTVFQGATAPLLDFGIFNAAGDRVGLDLDSFDGKGDLAQLYADLTGFSALAAGASQGFLAKLDTAVLGNFLTSYTLKLSDADVGAASSRFDHTMTLNLKGSVVSARPQLRVNDVPEPGMLALVSAGLLGLALTRRRTRRG